VCGSQLLLQSCGCLMLPTIILRRGPASDAIINKKNY
jgi:hypothetical protein